MQEKVLCVAGKLFAKNGFAGASMSMIAEAVGIKKSSLYYFFKNKEAIYLELLEEILDEVIEVIKDKQEKLPEKLLRMFKISAKNGPLLFSVQKLSSCSFKSISKRLHKVDSLLLEYLSLQKLRVPAPLAMRLILDTTQMYARCVSEKTHSLTPKEYSTLLTTLLEKA